MKALICDACGSNSLIMDPSGEFATCEHCGLKYTKETLRIKIENFRGTVNVDGPVETIIGNAELERRYSNFIKFIELKDKDNAESTLRALKHDFPNDARVWLGTLRMAAAFCIAPELEDVKRATVCGSRELLIKECDEFIRQHGNNLLLNRPAAYEYKAHRLANMAELNDYYVLNPLEVYLIYQSKPLADCLAYTNLSDFIGRLTQAYAEGVRNGKICPLYKPMFGEIKIPVPQLINSGEWMINDEHLEGYICNLHKLKLTEPEYNGGPMKMGDLITWGIKATIGPWLIARGFEDDSIYRMSRCVVMDEVIEYRRKKHICIHCEAPMSRIFKYADCKVCGMPSYTR